jgi:pyruvate,water dikinase
MNKMIRTFEEAVIDNGTPLGGKGESLARLYQAGYPVPDGFVILPCAFSYDELKPDAWAQTIDHLDRLRATGDDVAFAVRSSALSEDSAQASFAGEFETVLNVCDDEAIYVAIQAVHHSRHSERVEAYSRAKGMDTNHEVAVIIQRLVRAEISGVLFTANPLNGNRREAMITATWGLGEAIVSGQVTPDTLIVDKECGQVLSRETGSKQVQTVLLDSKTEEQPVPQAQRRLCVLTDDQAAELVRLGKQIETLYGMPMDIEWTLTGGKSLAEGKFAIVQARPITTLPQTPAELEWKLPQGSYIAVRNNIVELMADPLTPLFGTLGLTSVNNSMTRLLTDFFGRSDLMPPEIIINVNEYAYYNGSWSFGQMMRILSGSIGIMKRMFSGAVERWIGEGRPQYVATVQKWQRSAWQSLPAAELLAAIRELSEAAVDAYGSLVSGVIPAAWISEGLFTFTYDKLIKRRGDPTAPTYLLGFDSMPIFSEKSLYDLAMWARTREGLADCLSGAETAEIVSQLERGDAPQGVSPADWQQWQTRFQAHLNLYGHAIYNLDFANPLPADDPAVLLDTCKWFMTGQGVNPHTRQETTARRREEATAAMLARLKGLRLKLFRKSLRSAQRYAPLRESGLADVGLGYPLLRQMLHELGRRFAAAGMIIDPEDIFWLKEEEVLEGAARLDRGESLENRAEIVPQRKAMWREAGQITPPLALPQRKFLGMDSQKMEAARARKGDEDTLKGVAASPGSKTATACVVHGPQDFAQMKTGDVLVAAMTTPAWTPLFARASAVVTDVGGPLSHGSIVAREYGIPAVLGTGDATRRIHSGQRITVNGSEGIVLVG